MANVPSNVGGSFPGSSLVSSSLSIFRDYSGQLQTEITDPSRLYHHLSRVAPELLDEYGGHDAERELESLKELSEKRLQEIEKLKLKLKKNNDSLAEQESTEASDTDTSIQEDEDVKWFQNGVRLFNPSLDSCKEVISKLEDKHEIMVLIASPSEIIQFLIPTILERKAIKQLTIYSSLSPEDILSFSSELSTNKSLTSLQIIHNSISDDGVFVLAQALQYNETLQYLYLNDNPDITSASAQSLAKLYKLSCLNLDNTNIDPNEVMDLMESLMQDQ
uniref:Uncharacterized protein n=2 Tax=Amphimedon queenslandica TaxID=400682 RepID=A0A1X7TBY9_AMPQE